MCAEWRAVHLERREPNGESVRRVGFRCLAQFQKSSHHETNLRLLRRAVTYDRLLYPSRRIFENRQSVLSCGEQCRSAGSAEGDCSAGVLDINETFDRTRFRPMIAYQFVDLTM